MKATGIVRKIDDLGRILIPKEIRKTMKIESGDPLEIFINSGGGITLRKFDPYDMEQWNSALAAAQALMGERVALYNKDGDKMCGSSALPEHYSEISPFAHRAVSIPETGSDAVIGFLAAVSSEDVTEHLASVKKIVSALMNKGVAI